jgi:ribosomal protein S17
VLEHDSADVTTTKTCTTPPKEIQVCRLSDKTIVTIKESEFDAAKYSKNIADCKVVIVKDIKVCRLSDDQIVTIKETEFDSAKYSKDLNDCNVPTPNKLKVCELANKTIVTIDEDAFDTSKYSKDLNACKEVVTPETPEVIASTGPETLLGGLIGSSALGLSISSYLRSRRFARG